MRAIIIFLLFLFFIFSLFLGVLLIELSLNLISLTVIKDIFIDYAGGLNFRLVVGIAGVLVVIGSIIVADVVLRRLKRQRTISFDNPKGKIVVTLPAIEDFIKRLVKFIPGVKEFKPHAKVTRRGMKVINRVVLLSDMNVPDTTERIQGIIKTKLQEMLGTDVVITVEVHVVKITQSGQKESDEKPNVIPYRNME